ncbi:uncharacterized protein LOC111866462 isoform X2 [Cryptotermes secundus]|uniref:uncharacterized protein LOC111866462 isoform X2 n=1 Tax=Cryptotermes secundus TaxID=105785 RepID=UPI000CD7AF50|nr:uncharacterized protein LOC111866462 isoform X2 [Cryptotermes secundus]
MAIPFNLPTQQDTEENYDILDQLLEQLYEVMLEILRQRRLRDQLYETMLEILRQRRRLRDSRSAIPTTLMPHNREAQRRENDADGGNGSGEPEPSGSQNQQQALNRDAMLRVLPQPDVVSNPTTRSAQSEVPIPPPRRCTPAGGVRVRPCPPPRRSRRSRSTSSNEKTSAVPTDNRTRENWQEVGKELRKIADQFCASSSPEVGGRAPDNPAPP